MRLSSPAQTLRDNVYHRRQIHAGTHFSNQTDDSLARRRGDRFIANLAVPAHLLELFVILNCC
jgi:hypothetical protein